MKKACKSVLSIIILTAALIMHSNVSFAKTREITLDSELNPAEFAIELTDIASIGSDEFEFEITVTSPPGWDYEYDLGSNDVFESVEYYLNVQGEPVELECNDKSTVRGMVFVCGFSIIGTPELVKNSDIVIIRRPRIEVLRHIDDRDSVFTSYYINHIFPTLYFSDCTLGKPYLIDDPIALETCS
jgi:hypothetical protein